MTTSTTDHNATSALSFDRVYSGYTSDMSILQDVSLHLPEGELRGLIGLNGAGKSTVLMTAVGFVQLHGGRVFFHGNDISNTAPYHCIDRGLYMLPQQSSLFPYMTVRQNLAFIAKKRGTNLDTALGRFNELEPYMRWRAGNLSGGWQKMVEFAKALLAKPQVLLVDEPTVGLSPGFAGRVYDWIDMIREEQNMSILLVDHNIDRVIKLADYMYVLSLGRIVAEGATSEFSGNLHEQVQKWLGLRGKAGEQNQ